MDLKEIRQIIEMMKRHDLSLFHLERDGMKIKLKKGVDYEAFLSSLHSNSQAPAPASSPLLPAAAAPAPPEVAATPSGSPPSTSGNIIESPMVGTFYRGPSPGEPPFVKEGDRVEEGMTICIIEAMKVMNEIKAEASGTLGKVLASDGVAVQFGQPLFELK